MDDAGRRSSDAAPALLGSMVEGGSAALLGVCGDGQLGAPVYAAGSPQSPQRADGVAL